jgi:hypothetical protein
MDCMRLTLLNNRIDIHIDLSNMTADGSDDNNDKKKLYSRIILVLSHVTASFSCYLRYELRGKRL